MDTLNEHDKPSDETRVDRRTAIKWVLAASAVMQLPSMSLAAAVGSAKGYGKDPDLLKIYQSNSLWPLTLNKPQRATAAVLCDLIIPADEKSPAASTVGVVDFLDEWISAPYEASQRDRPVIIEGLAWLDAESQRRFKKDFASISDAQRTTICDQISGVDSPAELSDPVAFFKRYRALTAGGFYTTPLGMKDLNYVGNVALTKFEGPPLEVLKKLGLA
jgi:hypothetical protein